MRIFKTKTLAKFTRQNNIGDASLVEAIARAARGLIDADLGGQVIKQRVARPGQGKRSGFRMLIGFRSDRAVFLFGFAKNERENIDADQLRTLREIVAIWLAADDAKIAQALKDGILIEVHDDKDS
ncbi:type II toxin-antitoxin system RelE/ParE family toxin [Tardiphaga robiniae]|uniref:type II toxin-antitoxin system RelE/ParE family toxin n=1 Tax=Tardiphaga robiniae TaxID=943830 RepID=UPI0015864217|nr:type II toxin-antitoxin system RelE/ParE family toxin [Tardiphaga robiniae]